jgi:REP element-mobilizing transposase RayT
MYHIVCRTKDSRLTIPLEHKDKLCAYLAGFTKNKNCHLYRVNGVEDHIHILTDISKGILPENFVRDIKVASSKWMKSTGLFPNFKGWSVGYGSFTCSYQDKDRLIEYIKKQEQHHKKVSFEDEYRELLLLNGIQPDERYFP